MQPVGSFLLVVAMAMAPSPVLGLASPMTDPATVSCPGVALAPRLATDRNPDGSQIKLIADRRGRFVPIIMLHGWTGHATHDETRTGVFSHVIDLATQGGSVAVPRSFIGQLQRLPGAAVFTFDYHDYSGRWVDDSRLGPALGKAIDCLHNASEEKVILVAHSMGGLVARWALTEPGHDRGDLVSTVVTFGSPQQGSLLARVLSHGIDAGANVDLTRSLNTLRTLLAICGQATSTQMITGSLCDLLNEQVRAFDSAAAVAMRAGSAKLATLPAFPSGIRVVALGGDTRLELGTLGWFDELWPPAEVPVGDIVVGLESAHAGATSIAAAQCRYQMGVIRGVEDQVNGWLRPFEANSTASPLWELVGAPCFHTNLTRTISLVNIATTAVREDIEGRSPQEAPPPPAVRQPVTININPSSWDYASGWNSLGPTYEGNPEIGQMGATHTHAFGGDTGSFVYQFYLATAGGSTAQISARLSSNFSYYSGPADGYSDVTLLVNRVAHATKRVISDNGSGVVYVWQVDPSSLVPGTNTVEFAVDPGAVYQNGLCVYHKAVVAGYSDASIVVHINP